MDILTLSLFFYVVPAILVMVQAFLIEKATSRKLPFSDFETSMAIIVPVWNWYMAFQLSKVIFTLKISIRPTIDIQFHHSIQILPSITYVIGSGFLILFPFYGSLTITPKESSEK